MEFQKRIDIDPPFYYFTDRFYEGFHPSFNEPSKQKKQRLPQRKQVQAASFISGRATFPVQGTLSTRPQFHKQPGIYHHFHTFQYIPQRILILHQND